MAQNYQPLIFGDTTRELWTIFSQNAGTRGVLNHGQIRLVINKLGLFPTKSQISEVVHWACENLGRAPADHITFGEFCVLITELQEQYRKSGPSPQPRSQLKEKAEHVLEERRKRRRLSGRWRFDFLPELQLTSKMIATAAIIFCKPTVVGALLYLADLVDSTNSPNFSATKSFRSNKQTLYQDGTCTDWNKLNYPGNFRVFLGGSCNPTTWRNDVAIPYLKEHNITFYNPQVSVWKPELIELEDQAKGVAEVLFFVVDNQTRSTSSMVEAAYLAGCGRQLILVIHSFEEPVTINEEKLSKIEIEDLQRSHAYLVDLVERMGIPVFHNIDCALRCTCKAIQQNTKVGDLSLDDGAQPVKFPHVRVADKLIRLNDAFKAVNTSNSGRLSLHELRLVYKTITDEDLPLNAVNGLARDKTFTFEDLCLIMAEYHYKRKSMMRRLVAGLTKVPQRISGWLRGQTDRRRSEPEGRKRDVFLGGSCGGATWREDIAMPILRKHGISYFNPRLPEWSTRYIPLEAAVKDSCRLLLYVITSETRSITSMIEAGHFIGHGCNVVLCVQDLKPGTLIEGERVSATGVKDYNRARSYLTDLANRDGIPVFDNVEEAVKNVVHRLRKIQNSL